MEYNHDVGTARCRLSPGLQRELGARLQSLVEIRVYGVGSDSERYMDVLCVAYPDTNEILGDDELCMDDSVCVGGTSELSSDAIAAAGNHCVIIAVHDPATCSSVHITPDDIEPRSLTGLPVCEGCTIKSNASSGRKKLVKVSKIKVPFTGNRGASGRRAAGIVSIETIMIRSIDNSGEQRGCVEGAETTTAATASGTGRSAGLDSCMTQAVKEIIDGVVTPSTHVSQCAQPTGALLIGPAGVGKTHAIHAVTKICQDWCHIHVVEVNLPDILAADDPVTKLKDLLDDSSWPSDIPAVDSGKEVDTPIKSPAPKFMTYQSPSVAPKTPCTPSSYSFLASSPHTAQSGMTMPISDQNSSSSSSPVKAKTAKPASKRVLVLLFLDEIDALGGAPTSQSEVQRVVTQTMCEWFDRHQHQFDSHKDKSQTTDGKNAIVSSCVIATTNRAQDVNSSLRRGGRLEMEINVTSTREDRLSLVQFLLKQLFTSLVANFRSETEVEIGKLAVYVSDRTGGYVSADLAALVSKAVEVHETQVAGSDRGSNTNGAFNASIEDINLWIESFDAALTMVSPSCLRGVSVKAPSIDYSDVIGNDGVKKALKRVLRFFNPSTQEKMARFGLKMPGGVLLHGPPGNSKTRLVMAAAAHHHLPVISLSAADVFSPYVGEAEAEVRKAFAIARQAAPCVLFLDELDAFVTNRGNDGGGGGSSSVEARVLATLLTEMDGIGYGEVSNIGGAGGVMVMGATNRIGAIDAALLRKGRFHHVLEVPAPDVATQYLLLDYFAKKCSIPQQKITQLQGNLKIGLSGADVENLCREAQLETIRERLADV